MKSTFINVLVFAAGAAIGSAVTWKIVKTRYDRIVQEEIESVREAFGVDDTNPVQEKIEGADDDEEGPRECPGQINWKELEDLDEDEDDEANMATYTRLTQQYTSEKGGSESMAKQPYVIAPYDFGELDGYHQVELRYYADGTVEDEEGNIVTDVDELIGVGSLNTFGEYEEDSVYVRNEYLETDFLILKDYDTYEKARHIGPNQVDDE